MLDLKACQMEILRLIVQIDGPPEDTVWKSVTVGAFFIRIMEEKEPYGRGRW